MTEWLSIYILVTAFWFPLYWILGGVLFAVMAIMKTMKLRRVRFSCLFTLASLLTAFAASYGGLYFVQKNGTACTVEEADYLDAISGVIGCGIVEFILAGFFGFLTLLVVGTFVMILSRARNQSWTDSDMGLEEAGEVSFDKAHDSV